VKHLKTGSAYYAPSSGAVQMVEAIVRDQRRILPAPRGSRASTACATLPRRPCKLGRHGLEAVIEVELTSDERVALQKSADAVREPMGALKL
jgi:malate dehydrogenase